MPKLRHIAPAGTPITIGDLAGWAFDIATATDRTEALKAAISKKFGVKHCFLMASGRAALAMIFSMMAEKEPDDRRNEVILPAYTCYSVPAAAELAGLRIRICEIDPLTLDYDHSVLSNMDTSRVLALVSANLYGCPNSLAFLESFCTRRGIFFVDDAAQSMNARFAQRYAGTFGDIGIYSLDKGKNISTIQGGIIVTNNDSLARNIEDKIASYPYPDLLSRFREGMKILLYSLLLHPRLYWIPANISALGLGKTVYTTNYLFTRFSRHLSSMAIRLFSRIDEISTRRCEVERSIRNVLVSIPGIAFITPLDQSSPVCLRSVLLIDDPAKRDALLLDLKTAGIGASTSYPQSLTELNDVRSFKCTDGYQAKNGAFIAARILTLPTLSYISKKDLQAIKRVFERHLQ